MRRWWSIPLFSAQYGPSGRHWELETTESIIGRHFLIGEKRSNAFFFRFFHVSSGRAIQVYLRNLCYNSSWATTHENCDGMGLVTRRWRREFNKAVKLPSRDTIFDYFLSIENGECRFEPWTKHKIFKVIDFDSNKMQMNEVFQAGLEWYFLAGRVSRSLLSLNTSKTSSYRRDLVRGALDPGTLPIGPLFLSCRCLLLLRSVYVYL